MPMPLTDSVVLHSMQIVSL